MNAVRRKPLRKITQEELKEILRKHELWVVNDPNGEKADLSYADLRDADVRCSNLFRTKLFEADLENANFFGSVLIETDLNLANVKNTNFKCTEIKRVIKQTNPLLIGEFLS